MVTADRLVARRNATSTSAPTGRQFFRALLFSETTCRPQSTRSGLLAVTRCHVKPHRMRRTLLFDRSPCGQKPCDPPESTRSTTLRRRGPPGDGPSTSSSAASSLVRTNIVAEGCGVTTWNPGFFPVRPVDDVVQDLQCTREPIGIDNTAD